MGDLEISEKGRKGNPVAIAFESYHLDNYFATYLSLDKSNMRWLIVFTIITMCCLIGIFDAEDVKYIALKVIQDTLNIVELFLRGDLQIFNFQSIVLNAVFKVIKRKAVKEIMRLF